MFLKVSKGGTITEDEAFGELMELSKTNKQWRIYRKDLFRQANDVRIKMGLKGLGT